MTTALIVASTALAAGGAVAGGVAENNAAKYRARIGEMNAQIAEANAARSEHKAQIEAQDQDALTLAQLGEQTATQSASGLAVNSRSFRLIRKSTKELGRKDTLNIRNAGDVAAYNAKTDAINLRAGAQLDRMSGRSALTQSFFNAGSSLISGASKIRRARMNSYDVGGY